MHPLDFVSEFYEEQEKKENVVARSKIKLFSPTEEALQAWKHCDVALWSLFAGHHVDSNSL
jgi:hypothetical protein